MCFADPASNPRPRRTRQLLRELGYHVDLLSFPTGDRREGERHFVLPGAPASFAARVARKARSVAHLGLRRLVPSNRFRDDLNHARLGIAGFESELGQARYDVIVAHDIYLLSLARRIRGSARLVFDAREFYPRQNDEHFWFRISEQPERERICRAYLRECDAVITVSPGLADAYARAFGVRPHVVMSTPSYHELEPTPTEPDRFRIVHLGIANPNRQLEKMIDVAAALDDRFTLDFYLTGSEDYIRALRERAASCGRVRVLPPVPFERIIPTLNAYDIGLCYFEPLTFNLLHCLPNKLFEFIQARLMIATGPSPDIAQVTREHDCGVVADSFAPAAMAAALARLTTADVQRAKRNSAIAARVLCFEQESRKLRPLLEPDPRMAASA